MEAVEEVLQMLALILSVVEGGNIWGPPQMPWGISYCCNGGPDLADSSLVLAIGRELGIRLNREYSVNWWAAGNVYCEAG